MITKKSHLVMGTLISTVAMLIWFYLYNKADDLSIIYRSLTQLILVGVLLLIIYGKRVRESKSFFAIIVNAITPWSLAGAFSLQLVIEAMFNQAAIFQLHLGRNLFDFSFEMSFFLPGLVLAIIFFVCHFRSYK